MADKRLQFLSGRSAIMALATTAGIAAGAFALSPALAQQTLPVVAGPVMDIGQCRAPTSHAGTDRILSCTCPARAGDPNHSSSAWGSDVYTADSYICTTARHAGVIGADGGRVTLQMLPGRSSYAGSKRNGVQTRKFGKYRASYRYVEVAGQSANTAATGTAAYNAVFDLPGFDMSMIYSTKKKGGGLGGVLGAVGRTSGNRNVRDAANVGAEVLNAVPGGSGIGAEDIGECKGVPPAWREKPGKLLSCTCPASPNERSPVWGTGTYSNDSYICKAAIHAGAIDRSGGRVAIEILPDQLSYQGSRHNGISTMSYGKSNRLGAYRFIR